VDVAEFERIQGRLPESQKMLVLICMSAGVAVAGLVVATVGKTAIYLLAATGDSGLDARGSYLLQWHAMRHLRESGHHWYDLGGINQEKNPGVFTFKTGMGGTETTQLAAVELSRAPLSRIAVALGGVVRSAAARMTRVRPDRS
jgi:lipid II:glycine glycyltransferase (peptidoglycan interpeptide bridge formation enzyme)